MADNSESEKPKNEQKPIIPIKVVDRPVTKPTNEKIIVALSQDDPKKPTDEGSSNE